MLDNLKDNIYPINFDFISYRIIFAFYFKKQSIFIILNSFGL